MFNVVKKSIALDLKDPKAVEATMQLIEKADRALYAAKAAGRGGALLFQA